MRLLVQRVQDASVQVGGDIVGAIGVGLLVFVGFGRHDPPTLPESRLWHKIVEKLVLLRLFPNAEGQMNLSVQDVGGELLLVPQFTLYADCWKGNRPGFQDAAGPKTAEMMFDAFIRDVRIVYPRVQSGIFGSEMLVRLTNWGPVSITLDSAD